MKNDCHYHPGEPAKWHCGSCLIHYCAGCMPDADPRRRHGLCPHCGQAMRYLGAATQVVPFWNRLSAFFRYPFHTDPLIVIAICTLVPMFLSRNLLGVAVSLLLLLALFKYTYTVIRHTAEGHMKPPPLAAAFSGGGFGIVVLQLLVFVVMGALITTGAMLGGPLLALLALAFVILALPASIMVLAMEQSVGAAVNPLNLATLIARIGWPYFLLYGYLILLTLASGAAQEFAVNHFEPWLAQPLSGFLNSTFTLILFHMLGYLLFQYQEELGFASDLQDGNDPAPHQRDRSRRVDADIDMALKDGQYDRVLGILQETLKRDPGNALRLGQLFRLLVARDDAGALYPYHPRLLAWLAEKRDAASMLQLLALLERSDPGFRVADPALAVRCAGVLLQQGEYRLVLKLLQDFHKRFPESDQLAPAYLLVARALANGFGQWDKAIRFLGFIQQRCPGHGLEEQVATCLDQARQRQPLREPRASFSA